MKRKAEVEPDSDNKIEQKKRVKLSYTKEQLLTLESLFGQNNFPNVLEREVAVKLKLGEKNIHVSLDGLPLLLIHAQLQSQPPSTYTYTVSNTNQLKKGMEIIKQVSFNKAPVVTI